MAHEIGYPVIIKAAGGGGGRGMRTVHTEPALLNAIAMTKAEAGSAFRQPNCLHGKNFWRIRAILSSRLMADAHGNAIHLV